MISHGCARITCSSLHADPADGTVPIPVALALLAAAVLVVDQWPGRRRLPIRAIFNAAQTVLSFGLGALVLVALGGLRADAGGLDTVLALVPSGATMFLVNEALTSTVIGLDRGMPVRRVIQQNFALNDLGTHYLFLALAPVLVAVWDHDPTLLPVLLVVMFATHRASREGIAARTEASHDLLTGLPNRRALDERIEQLLRQAGEDDTLSLLLLDLDGFHLVNDQIGRQIGDRLLVQVARRLDASYVIDDIPPQVDASVGVATAPGDGTDLASLLRVADAALATAKQRSRWDGCAWTTSRRSSSHPVPSWGSRGCCAGVIQNTARSHRACSSGRWSTPT